MTATATRRTVAALAALLGLAVSLGQADGPANDGLLITVPNPITEAAASQIEQRVTDAVERQGRSLSVVVFDFNPQGKPAGTTNAFPCLQLQAFITRLSLGQVPKCPRVLTVAYVSDEVTDHTVLPVLACREIAMAGKAKLGHVLRSQNKALDKTVRQAYEDMAKVWDPDRKWLLPKLLEPSADLALFDTAQAQKAGLCKVRLDSRRDVADQYGLPGKSLREDALEGTTPVVWRIEVHGALDGGKLNSMERRIKAAIRKKANTIILHLDCEGGETIDAASAAEKLRRLTDEGGTQRIRTIAYVPPGRSLGAATFLALGCSEIVMAPTARLGGFEYLRGTDPATLKAQQKMLADLAAAQDYHPAFFKAMFDPTLSVYQCRHKTRPGAYAVLTDADLKLPENSQWEPDGEPLWKANPNGEFPSLDAKTAHKYGIARYADVSDVDVLYQRYGFTNVETSRDDWLDAVASFLREPLVQVLLIMVGVAGLILELKMPGFGVPGIIAAICFVLFFWSHAVSGRSTWEFTLLAIFLFLLGVVLVGIEVLFLPGFGVTGISGILLIVVSLVLVMLEQMPATSQEWADLGSSLAKVGVGLVAGLIAALVTARFLPHIPYANRLVLQPPAEAEDGGEVEQPQHAALLGAIGVAATTLRPAGKAQFGDDFLDVIAEGDFVDAGRRVQVIEVEGYRIVVKQV
jgi:membrane-bound ClpP family serine protease